MGDSEQTNLAAVLRLRSALGEAGTLWTARLASIAGTTALLCCIASTSYILSFGAVRLSLYAAMHFVAQRTDRDKPAHTAALISLLRLLIGLHLCAIALDLALDHHLVFVGLLLLLGYTVVTAHQAQPNRRSYVLALAPPLVALAIVALIGPQVSPTNVATVALFLFALLLTAVRRMLTNRRLLQTQAHALILHEEMQQGVAQALIAEEVATMGSWRVRLPDRSQTWSPGVFRIFGLPVAAEPPSIEEVIAFYREGDRQRVAHLLQTSLAERRGFEFEHTIRRADGAQRVLRLRAHFAEEEGGAGSLYGVIQDVTNEREAFGALSRSEAQYRLVTEHATDMIATMKLDSEIEFVSPACIRILGYHPRELVGHKTLGLTHPDDVSRHCQGKCTRAGSASARLHLGRQQSALLEAEQELRRTPGASKYLLRR